jgi:hypothetical protein
MIRMGREGEGGEKKHALLLAKQMKYLIQALP